MELQRRELNQRLCKCQPRGGGAKAGVARRVEAFVSVKLVQGAIAAVVPVQEVGAEVGVGARVNRPLLEGKERNESVAERRRNERQNEDEKRRRGRRKDPSIDLDLHRLVETIWTWM